MFFLQVGRTDHIELSPGPEFEKPLASKTISIPEEGLWGGLGAETEDLLWLTKE